jgi:NADH:ubiquinone oxidoreductase subunit 5 (subunit L)/multisubunit Na+/H+ antiporter MnhA subunit
MYKLGGIGKKLPFTTVVFVIAMLGIIGFPGFNGYVSKTIVHHALTEAAHISHSFIFAEVLFIITSIATVAYFAKMFYYVFLRKTDREYKDLVFDISSLDLALGSIALLIIGVGLFPNFVSRELILPQLLNTTYDPAFVLSHVMAINLFALKDVLMSLAIIGGGVIVFLIAKRYRLFSLKFPKWLSLEYWFFLPSYLLMKNLCERLYGDKCPMNLEDFAKLTEKDIEKIGFIDRFVITAKVVNQRYEQSIIRSDALIYAFFITLTLLIMIATSTAI